MSSSKRDSDGCSGVCANLLHEPKLHFTDIQCCRMQLSEEFNVAVVITNHVVSDPSGGAVFVADPKKPVGGHVLAHACTIRLSLRKGKGEQRLMKVVDAPNLRERPLRTVPECDKPSACAWLGESRQHRDKLTGQQTATHVSIVLRHVAA